MYLNFIFLPVIWLWHKWLGRRIDLGLNTQPHAPLALGLCNLHLSYSYCIAGNLSTKNMAFSAIHYILTQAIFKRYQNSFCLFICICITAASAVFMFPTATSNLGNKSTMRRLHKRIVLQKKKNREGKLTLFVSWTLNYFAYLWIIYLRWVYKSLRTLSWFWIVLRMIFTMSVLSLYPCGGSGPVQASKSWLCKSYHLKQLIKSVRHTVLLFLLTATLRITKKTQKHRLFEMCNDLY